MTIIMCEPNEGPSRITRKKPESSDLVMPLLQSHTYILPSALFGVYLVEDEKKYLLRRSRVEGRYDQEEKNEHFNVTWTC
jgi:hypothetical protein